MEIKIECARCHEPKPLRNFGKRVYHRIARLRKAPAWAGKTEGITSYCRECRRLFTAEYYERKKDETYRWLAEYFKTHHCVDCDEDDPIVLDFDHRDGTEKKFAISEKIGRCSLRTLIAEIAKCDVRCSNCHRRRTAIQLNFRWVHILKPVADNNPMCTSS